MQADTEMTAGACHGDHAAACTGALAGPVPSGAGADPRAAGAPGRGVQVVVLSLGPNPAWRTLATLLYYAQPFIREFIEPMDFVDPSGARLREAYKRFQQLGAKSALGERPFGKFALTLQDLYHRPVIRAFFGKGLGRVAGVGERL